MKNQRKVENKIMITKYEANSILKLDKPLIDFGLIADIYSI
jgi:hypothetical protein